VLKLAALAVAAASTASSPNLVSNTSWWERVTVTIAGDGEPAACQYQTSQAASAARACDVVDAPTPSAVAKASKTPTGANDQFTKITFERRFVPGITQPAQLNLQPGDTLLGGQVMALAIDEGGSVKGCEVVAKAGSVTPDYGCDEVEAEKFQASAGQAAAPQGFMTILVYGHQENVA
jgi:hypothetical protein